ncbi:hypothetical protein BC629DRAFT_802584 [Irpex lacteus]|nr:hypothetical protein BC629DRAFT_802584 [Irpex lacteus]
MATTAYAYSPSSARLFPLNIGPPQPATTDSFLSTLWHVETARFRRLHRRKPLRRARPVTRFTSDANNLSYGLSSKLGLWQLSQYHSPISYICHSSMSATFDGSESVTLQQIATTTVKALCSLEVVFSDAMRYMHHMAESLSRLSSIASASSYSATKHLTIPAVSTVVLSATYLAALCAPATHSAYRNGACRT